ncbi:DUF2953 domain-containing protein [Bacillus canaveralius]|uniref:DUF2953 domain-containing protein n=1 Tax=Bacillus canaveralius TaxID=1403243 RepID=UPI000F783BEC|nr:DUF2953 domain-containing protein [Bacillus canaveralius]RSK53039.1 DUF2953 domain-containing protein [Bacillus canaveralius]
MNWVAIGLIILMVTIFLIAIIVMSKLTVYVYFNHYNGNNHLQLEFKVWFGLVKYRVDVPLPTANEDSGSAILNEEMEHDGTNPSQEYGKDPGGDLGTSLNDVKKLLDEMGQLHRILKNFLKQIAIKHLEWHSVVGVGDAASTAVLTGGIWALKGSIIGMISSYMKLKMMPVLSIAPGFQQVISETSFTCMLQFRIGHAMVAGIKMIKFGKGAGLRFITKPFSAHSENKAKSI